MTQHALVVLEELRIAAPCPARWEDMPGDDRTRLCGQCAQRVYNLKTMTRTEAQDLLRRQSPCIQLFRRADGTVITADCYAGRAELAFARAKAAALGAVVLVLTLAGALAGAWFRERDQARLKTAKTTVRQAQDVAVMQFTGLRGGPNRELTGNEFYPTQNTVAFSSADSLFDNPEPPTEPAAD